MIAWLSQLLVWAAVPMSSPAAAEDISPPASEWRSYCQAYVRTLDGDATASDLDVTYCLGITKGLLNGLRVGSQVGALSFGSLLAIRYKLDPDEVFKLFQTHDPSRMLGVCSLAATPTADYVRAVLAYLEKSPDALNRPIGEVFFEGLQEAYPCR